MGRTVGAILGIVAAVAIAVAAPYLAVSVLGFVAGSTAAAIATAVIAIGLSVAASLAFKALGIGSVPSAKGVTDAAIGTAIVGVFSPAASRRLQPRMAAVIGGFTNQLRRACFGRFGIVEFVGDCLAPHMTDRFGIVDLDAEIRAGDIMSFGVRDMRTAFPDYTTDGVCKRFLGIDVQNGVVRVDCTNPPRMIETGLDNLLYGHRVRATAPTRWKAIKLLWRVRWRPEAFDERRMGRS